MTDEEALADLERRRADFVVYPAGATKTFNLGDRVRVKCGDTTVTGTVVSGPVGAEHGLYGVLPDATREKLQNLTPEDRTVANSGILSVAVEALELIPIPSDECS